MLDYLKSNWKNLTSGYPAIKDEFFDILIQAYSSPKRHYHNLTHIASLLKLTDEHFSKLQSPDVIRFTIWYHDVVYNVLKSNNEEKSAVLAKKQMSELNVKNSTVNYCCKLIVATKTHSLPKGLNSFDAKFMMDIDLSILSVSRENYIEYTKQIHKEYSIYPDLLYKKGRKKVLKHFLNKERIYKTDLFFQHHEKKARKNLAYELEFLN